jgi:hypothetical protein
VAVRAGGRHHPDSWNDLEENIRAGDLQLSTEDVQAVRDVAAKADAAQGERYPAAMVAQMFVETPAL